MSLVEKALQKIQKSGVGPMGTGGSSAYNRHEVSAPAAVPPSAGTTETRPSDSGLAVKKVVTPRRSGRIVNINRDAIRAAGLLPPVHQERQIADQYRQIKRPLIAAAMRKGSDALRNGHLIMVTSALSGDGKTFTSINLSLSMSVDKDINVLLIDADVAKRHVSRLLEVESEPGLLDALQDESTDVESLILETDVQGLSILPAGRRTENANELLASQRMQDIVDSLANSDPQRIAIIDSSPLLLTGESRVIAQAVTQIVMVVRADKTPQDAVLDALSHIEESKSVGLVLNQSLDSVRGYYYGYGEDQKLSV